LLNVYQEIAISFKKMTGPAMNAASTIHLTNSLSETLSKALIAGASNNENLHARVVNGLSENKDRFNHMKFRLGLLEKLQISLDPQAVLETFHNEIQQILPVDGMSFEQEIADINIHVAHHADHRFTYSLVTSKELVGELTISRNEPFNAEELTQVRHHLDTVVYPLRNALNHQEAITASLKDPLTGAGNRIALNSSLQREIELTKRYSQPLSVLMLDMDNFKNINDIFGHSQGDEVLVSVVETMQEDLRGSDFIFRYGGEEFVILLSNTVLERAIEIAERLRSKIEQLAIEEDGIRIITTSSIGIAMLEKSDTINRLLDRADEAMYKAKTSGRNQVIVSREPIDF
jgi:diguanylate cyclase (GGDEF)-like protein